MKTDHEELQYLAYELLYNEKGKRFLTLFRKYFARQTVIPAETPVLAKFGNDMKVYLSYHQGICGSANHIENLMEGFANAMQAENKQGDKHDESRL